MSDLASVLSLLDSYKRKKQTNRLLYYTPYQFQTDFHHAKGSDGGLARKRVLMAGNQCGKTMSAAAETAMHLTGLYPDWWEGHRFKKPVDWLVGSTTNETGRDICQKELFGDPDDERKLGTGTIPIDAIGERIRKPGVPNAYSAAMVKHVSGGLSKVSFRAYEQGPQKHMGLRIDGGWLDEEPPQEIWSQYLRATFATNGILLLTFTPESGVTQVVHHFMYDLQSDEALIRATWEDAKHMSDPAVREKHLAGLSPHERDMRSKGIPLMGSGLVFPVDEASITITPIDIPKHWPRLCGVDFGYDHPFAAAWLAWDRDSDTVYVYDCYRESKATPPIHAAAIKARGDWIPVVWPHDGLQHDKGSGVPLADQYREMGVNMLKERFSNPSDPWQKEGQGGQGVEAGITEMLTRMQTGRFKIFSTCTEMLDEIRIYHRKDGKLVKVRDDLVSAARYATQSLRFAEVQAIRVRQQAIPMGVSNWN